MSMTLSPGILSVSRLSFRYDGTGQEVLRDLSLEIPAGTITAILGPNGSGKTTLLRLLLGILRPQAGSIRLAGRPLGSYSPRERSQLLGLVPQDEHIPFDFSVLEYVLLGRAPYLRPLEMPGEADRQIALEALRMAGVEQFQDRPLPILSGGERQLVTIARALAQQPRVLLLDEPTAHLDLGNRGRMLDLLRLMAARGMTLVLTGHDPNLAVNVAHLAVLLRAGQIVESGPAERVLTADKLSATYGVPVQVFPIEGRRVIVTN